MGYLALLAATCWGWATFFIYRLLRQELDWKLSVSRNWKNIALLEMLIVLLTSCCLVIGLWGGWVVENEQGFRDTILFVDIENVKESVL